MNSWDEACVSNDRENQIRMMIDGQNMVLFFLFDNELYGTQEPHRVTFAKMINPNEDEDPESWGDDANFMAVNLSRAVVGHPSQHMFKKKDASNIEVISNKEKVYDILSAIANEVSPDKIAASAKMLSKSIGGDDNNKKGKIALNQDEEE